jgi:hypothetical protein
MDPSTIGLLISIAPTVLDLLFGRGTKYSDIKHELILENPKEMYGYGLEGYGYRYPPIEAYSEEAIPVGTITKGPRKGLEIKRYPPIIDKKWVATYLLNKQYGANRWREIAKKYLQAASQEYLNDLKKTDREAYARVILNKLRKRKRDKLPLALRTPEGKNCMKNCCRLKKIKQNFVKFITENQEKKENVKH